MIPKRHSILLGLVTAILAGCITMGVMGVNPLAPFQTGQNSFVAVESAHAWGGSTWRRVRNEARRARDRIRKELDRARARAEREAKRAAVRVKEGDLSVRLSSLQANALQYLTTVTAATPFLPVSQIVTVSLTMLEYERTLEDMKALDMEQTEVDRVLRQLESSEVTLVQLENVRVDPTLRLGLIPPPAGAVQSAETARVQYEQTGEYLGILFLEAAFYEQAQGEMPRRRPVTLIYKIGQALLDYAQLTADIRLIAQSQPEHADLYDELVTRGRVGSVVTLLTSALTYLETMEVSGLPDPAISPRSRVGRLLTSVDALIRAGDTLITQEYASPLMVAPTRTIASMDAKIQEITHDRNRPDTAWILLLPQSENDALDDARARLVLKRDQVAAIHVYTPQELVSRYFLEALILWPRYQQLGTRGGDEAAVLFLEIRNIRTKLQGTLTIVETQHLSFPSNLLRTVRTALQNLEQAELDLARRMNSSSSSSSSSSVSVAVSSRTISSRTTSVATAPLRQPVVPKPSSASAKSTQTASPAPAMPAVVSSSSSAAAVASSSYSSAAVVVLPAPRITDPAQNPVTVTVSQLDVYGLVDNRTQKLLVNGKPATSYTPTSGKFWITLVLVAGQNVFELQAVDGDGQTSAVTTLTVTYKL